MEREILQQLPKVELHCHLDGSLSQKLLQKLAEQAGLPQALVKEAVVPENCESLADYLRCFDVVLPLLQTAENLTLAAIDVIEQAASENICYLEIRFAPELHREKGLSLAEVITAVAAGVKQGEALFDIHVNLLICGMRHHETAVNQAVFQAAADSVKEKVVGVDFAGDEANYPPAEFGDFLAFAKQHNLQITLHAGECGCPRNVVESIQLGAKRIGHGVAIKDDVAAQDFCREQQVLIELCPTSNLQTKAVASIAEYPFRQFFDSGLLCSINTDNRGVSQTNLTQEYQFLVEHFALTQAEMQQLNLQALTHSFAAEAVKKELAEKITKGYQV
ncbi:adenosine deaminase [Enterococcus sp. LJL90]